MDHPKNDGTRQRRAAPREGWRALLVLAWPLVLVNLGNVTVGSVHTMIVGRFDTAELAAVGLGGSLYFACSMIGVGVTLGLDPLISQAIGAGEVGRARSMVRQTVWLAAGFGAALAVVLAIVVALLPAMGIEADLARRVARYVHVRAPCLPLLMGLVGCRTYLQGHGVTRPLVVGVVAANVVNAPLSWLLVLGDSGLERLGLESIGLPALGARGAAAASVIAYVVQLVIGVYAIRQLDSGMARVSFAPDLDVLRRTLRLGMPVALQLLAEVAAFALAAFLAGRLGKTPLAAHFVAISLASITFQVPMGIGAASAVLVGHAVGRGDSDGVRRIGRVTLTVTTIYMVLSSVVLLFASAPLAAMIAPDPTLVRAATPLVLIAAFFQLADGLQAAVAGALRGAGDTRWPLAANLAGYYVVGMPLSLVLGFELRWGAEGIWWGLSAALTLVALGLVFRWRHVARGSFQRV